MENREELKRFLADIQADRELYRKLEEIGRRMAEAGSDESNNELVAKAAAELGCNYFTTTLSISPHKNAKKLNEIGEELAGIYRVPHLPSDFKKRNGYKRSVELSNLHGMYRQDYCGCVFSFQERMRRNGQ